MALRLRYSQMECNNGTLQLIVKADLRSAITTALSQTPAGETLHILTSSMLEVRQVLTGRKIL